MGTQAFLLDSNATGYAAALTALATYDAAHFDFTPTQTVRDASHDSTLKIVFANVTEAELDADGDLADLRTANFPTELCRERWTTLEEFRIRGFHMLGESVRSSEGVSGATCWYVRQEKYPTRSAYGEDTGKTPYDAADGWDDLATKLTDSEFQRGDLHYALGCNWAFRDGEAFSSINSSPDFPGGSGNNVTWRMDHGLMPGMNFMGFVDRTSPSNTWTQPDSETYPRLWKATMNNTGFIDAGMFLLPIDPTLSTSDIYTHHLFYWAESQSEVESTTFSVWLDGSDLWVHMPDDTTPDHRIGRPNNGFKPKYRDVTTLKGDFKFINCQMIAGLLGAGGLSSGAAYGFPNRTKFLGGRYLFGSSWKPKKNDSLSPDYDGTEWGRSTDGIIGWDTSDRPDPATDTFIAKVVSRHSSDQTVWNEMDHFLEIDSANEGIYWNGGGNSDLPDGLLASGVLARNIGSAHANVKAKNGHIFVDNDGHFWGTQGLKNSTVEFVYIQNAYAAIVNYSIGDSTTCQDNHDNILQDFIIRDSGSDNSSFGAGSCGVQWPTGDNDFGSRTDGSGDSSGNIIRRGVIDSIVSPNTPNPIDGYAIQGFASQLLTIDNVTMSNCDHCLGVQARNTTDSTYTDYPDTLDFQVAVSNCYFETPNYYFWLWRTTGWTTASPANIGYIDSNNNVYTYPAGDTHNVSLRFYEPGGGAQTYDDWVTAMTKASPPGAAATVLDPDSTFQVAS